MSISAVRPAERTADLNVVPFPIGPALTFGYVAGRALAQQAERPAVQTPPAAAPRGLEAAHAL